MSEGIKSAEGLQNGLRMAAAAALGREVERLFEVYFESVTEDHSDPKSINAKDALRRGMKRGIKAYQSASAMIREEFASLDDLQ